MKEKTKSRDTRVQTLCVTSPEVVLAEGASESVIELLRVGTIRDRDLHITREMLDGHVQNFKDGVYGVDLQVNLGHFREGEAAGWIKDVYVEDVGGVPTEFARVEWNEMGKEKISKKLYKYISAEFAFEYQDDASGEWRSHVLIGAALTNIPAMKRQKPVSLSEEELNLKTLMFKQVIESLKKRTKLSVEDIAMARQLLSEASAEDQEANKSEVEDLAKKQEEQAAADAAAKVKADEEAAKAESEKQALSEKNGTVSLAEHNAMKQKLARIELSEEVKSTLMLSSSKSVGFREEALSNVLDFMVSLSDTQRSAFKDLMGKVVSVDLSTRGADGDQAGKVVDLSNEDAKADAVVALTSKLMAADAKLSAADAQKKAYAEVFKK